MANSHGRPIRVRSAGDGIPQLLPPRTRLIGRRFRPRWRHIACISRRARRITPRLTTRARVPRAP
jgi:hypothetical protein